jgi:hypothetical protein
MLIFLGLLRSLTLSVKFSQELLEKGLWLPSSCV